MSEQPTPEKKIIVDEDWKARVEAERQQAAQPKGDRPAASPSSDALGDDGPMPPPGLLYLASSMYFQALVCLGLLPHPTTGKPEPSLRRARHAIDTLEILWEKTEGHRTPHESEALDSMLHELRLAYLNAGSASKEPPQSAG